MKTKKKIKIHKDQKGRDYIKKSYFMGGKMKFRRVYVIDGISADEFYEKNATDIDHLRNGEYWLISSEKDSCKYCDEPNNHVLEPYDDKFDDLPF